MKERIINNLKYKLSSKYDSETVNEILMLISLELNGFTIVNESRELMVPTVETNRKIVQMFGVAKQLEGKSENTVKQYNMYLNSMLLWVGKPVPEIVTNDIRSYIAHKTIDDGNSAISINNQIGCFNSFFGWLSEEEYISKNPMTKIKKVKEPQRERKGFTDVEVELMRNELSNARDKAIFEFLLSTGCRVSELVGCNIADITGDEATVLGKGNKQRIVYLNARSRVAIDEYLKQRGDDNGALFVNLREPHNRITKAAVELVLRNLGKASGIDKVYPHRFRHTVATQSINRGMPLEVVQQILGHENPNTTLVYAHLDKENVKTAHKKYLA